MGPRLASRGSGVKFVKLLFGQLLQWDRGSRAAEASSGLITPQMILPFNGTAAREPRKRGMLPHAIANTAPFNGTAAREPRKLAVRALPLLGS